MDAKNPLSFFDMKQRIDAGQRAHVGRYVVIALPNIANIFYGRDVGYAVECLELDPAHEAVSANAIRRQMRNS